MQYFCLGRPGTLFNLKLRLELDKKTGSHLETGEVQYKVPYFRGGPFLPITSGQLGGKTSPFIDGLKDKDMGTGGKRRLKSA